MVGFSVEVVPFSCGLLVIKPYSGKVLQEMKMRLEAGDQAINMAMRDLGTEVPTNLRVLQNYWHMMVRLS